MSAPFAAAVPADRRPAVAHTRADVSTRVRDLICRHLHPDADPCVFGETSSLHDDLGADSLDDVEIVMLLEEEFTIELTDEAMERITTIGDAVTEVIDALTADGRPVAMGRA